MAEKLPITTEWPGTEPQYRFAVLRATRPDLTDCQCGVEAGWAKSTAPANATKAKRLGYVQEIMARLREEQAERAGVTGDQIIAEMSRLAFSQITDAIRVDANGLHILPTSDWSPAATAAVQSVSESSKGAISLRMHAKLPALDMIAKHLDLYGESEANKDEEQRRALIERINTLPDKEFAEFARAVRMQALHGTRTDTPG